MTTAPPQDQLAPLASPEVQRQAAQMVQDAFTRLFRLTLEGDIASLDEAVGELARRSANWAKAGSSDEAAGLRLALLIAGMDQWGLAYTQAFALSAIPGLSALLGKLRTELDARADAHFARQFAALDAGEGNAIDFKMALRRQIHLALWHALIAGDDDADAERIATTLGSLLLSLQQQMPTLGWRLVADALAHIQIRTLEVGAETGNSRSTARRLSNRPAEGRHSSGEAGETANERTERLFAALRQALPADIAPAVFALANQAAVAWQQAQRPTQQQVH